LGGISSSGLMKWQAAAVTSRMQQLQIFCARALPH